MTYSAACTTTVRFARSHFTGKERDLETGNDYFEARYYSSNLGRFMSPDWSAKEDPIPYAKLSNPQTLNLYAYVGNNPQTGVDADGHCAAQDALCQGFNAGFDALHQVGSSAAVGQLQQSLARNDQRLQRAQQQLYLNNLAAGLRLVRTADYSPGEGIAMRSVDYRIENTNGTPYISGNNTGKPDLWVNEIITGGQPEGTTETGDGRFTSASPDGQLNKNQWHDSLGNKLSPSNANYNQSFIVSGASGLHPAISAPILVRFGGNDYGTLVIHIVAKTGSVTVTGLAKSPTNP